MTRSNKADPPNPAMTIWLHSKHPWRGVGDQRRTAPMSLIRNLAFVFLMVGAMGCDEYRADLTRGMPSTCEVHHTQMFKTNAPIEYGLIRLNDYGRARQAASTNSFPHAQECVLGGCIVGSATQAVVYVCPDCQKALQKWEVGHESSKPKS